jgi:amidase
MPLGNPGSVELKRLRVAFYSDNGLYPPTPETTAVVTKVARKLSHARAEVAEDRPRELTPAYELPWKIFGADGGAALRELITAIGCERIHPYLERNLERLRARPLSASELDAAVAQLDSVRSAMSTFWSEHDALVCPVCPFPAPPHGEAVSDEAWLGFSYTVPYNVAGWPVVTVRAGESAEGLPIGVQVVAPPWREDVALAVADIVEKEFGGWKPPAIRG